MAGTWGGTKWAASLHQFVSDEGSMDYGEETDLLVSRAPDCGPTAGIKYADHSEDGFSDDASKVWIWLAYSF
ncbi:MAG: hypothetical protein CMJ98_00115 [Planctomycetes bacterium]|nr:hypothetical protein [Planctomycetota bacterium]HJM56672.1 hypothetical protein [Planctomycetota bacterium]